MANPYRSSSPEVAMNPANLKQTAQRHQVLPSVSTAPSASVHSSSVSSASERFESHPSVSTPAPPVHISVIMPCLNEVRTLPAYIHSAIDGIRATNFTGEIIIADNGSTDG